MELWAIGRVLNDGTRQTYSNDDGNVKTFSSEAEAKQFITDNGLEQDDAFTLSVDTANVVPLMPGGNA